MTTGWLGLAAMAKPSRASVSDSVTVTLSPSSAAVKMSWLPGVMPVVSKESFALPSASVVTRSMRRSGRVQRSTRLASGSPQ